MFPFPSFLCFDLKQTGATAALLNTPAELIKIRLQTARLELSNPAVSAPASAMAAGSGMRQYSGVRDCVMTAVKQGGLRNLYKGIEKVEQVICNLNVYTGFCITAVKDSGAGGIFWLLYHKLLHLLSSSMRACLLFCLILAYCYA